jgi:hypothetical protein
VIHQSLLSGLAGQATDFDIAARKILWFVVMEVDAWTPSSHMS